MGIALPTAPPTLPPIPPTASPTTAPPTIFNPSIIPTTPPTPLYTLPSTVPVVYTDGSDGVSGDIDDLLGDIFNTTGNSTSWWMALISSDTPDAYLERLCG